MLNILCLPTGAWEPPEGQSEKGVEFIHTQGWRVAPHEGRYNHLGAEHDSFSRVRFLLMSLCRGALSLQRTAALTPWLSKCGSIEAPLCLVGCGARAWIVTQGLCLCVKCASS